MRLDNCLTTSFTSRSMNGIRSIYINGKPSTIGKHRGVGQLLPASKVQSSLMLGTRAWQPRATFVMAASKSPCWSGTDIWKYWPDTKTDLKLLADSQHTFISKKLDTRTHVFWELASILMNVQRDWLLSSLYQFPFPRAWERTKRGFLFWNINPFVMIWNNANCSRVLWITRVIIIVIRTICDEIS